MAQMRAGQGRTANQIRQEMQIPQNVAQAAANAPLARGSAQALVARGFYESVYGSRSAHRENLFARMDRVDRALARAQQQAASHPTPDNRRRVRQLQRLSNRLTQMYQNLPEEYDAFRVEAELQSMMDTYRIIMSSF